jgi:DNA-binding transcriptional LysR family regulator
LDMCFSYNTEMELRRFRYFVTVAEEMSLNRAAQKLHMPQSPLSSQIMHDSRS